MSAEYRIDIHTKSGVKVAEMSDYRYLRYQKHVFNPGFIDFEINGNHRILSQLESESQILIYRRNPPIIQDYYCDMVGIYDESLDQYQGKINTFYAYAPGIMNMLSWRINAFRAGVSNRSTFTNVHAETIMKNLVYYNLGAGATTGSNPTDRLSNGVISGVTVATDQARGNVLSVSLAYDNVFEALQKLRLISGGDFSFTKTGDYTFQFEFHPDQLGTDRTSTLVFSIDRDNILEPKYKKSYVKYKNIAIVGGKKENLQRDITIVDESASSTKREVFVSATDAETAAARTNTGSRKLDELDVQELFEFRVKQSSNAYYGKHYFVGDLAKVTYKNINKTVQIVGASITFSKNAPKEHIDVQIEMRP